MINISGLITGSLGYSCQREFLSNSIGFRDVQNFNYEIFSVDFGINPLNIQNQIQQQFLSVYSGDVTVRVFRTENSYSFPSDSLNATKYNVSVELKSPSINLSGNFPELSTSYYKGLDSNFWNQYGYLILGFKEEFNFSTNTNGNRIFDHNVSFGIQTGWSGDNSTTGRKAFAQSIVSYIFSGDTGTTFGLDTMIGQISGVANTGTFRNYYSESYDLFKNTYSFGRKREELPFDGAGVVINLNNSITMNGEGIMEVSERANTVGNISFQTARNNLESYFSSSYNRCLNIYNSFYSTGIIMQDSQYINDGITNSNLLVLINTPVKVVRTYDSCNLTASYDVSYTNNPTFSGDGTITSQNLEFNIGDYNRVEAIHSFDYTVNRIINPASYIVNLINNTTGNSPTLMNSVYLTDVSGVSAIYPNLNLIKSEVSWPNIKTKASAKMHYSNSPIYFVNVNGVTFNMLDITVSNKLPVDMVNEFQIVNRPNKQSVLSYAYQTDKGEISITAKALVGRHTNAFYPDGIGDFLYLDGGETMTISTYLQALYKSVGQVFLQTFGIPTVAFNWFISDSKYSLDSDGNLNLTVNYVYTIKKRLAANFP